MNAHAVIGPEKARRKKAPATLAPAASLAGMRLWKDAPGDAGPDPQKPGCLAEPAPATAATTPLAAPPPHVVPLAEPAQPLPDTALVPPPLPPEAIAPEFTVADGGIEPHVSPFPQRARDARRKDSDILGYWARIRGDRPMPAWKDLDQNQIAYFWPNSFLLACVSRGDHAPPMIARASRIVDDDGLADRSGDFEFTAPMVSWIVRVSRDVATVAAPLDDHWTFPTASGAWMKCDLIAMPLSETGERVDAVLCHVKQAGA